MQSPAAQRPDWQIAKLPASFFVGKKVLVPCQTQCGLVEHLNIRVVAVEDDALIGELDGQPFFAMELDGVTRVRVTPAQVVWVQETLEQWQSAVARLRQGDDYHNPWRGEPRGWQFEHLYDRGLGPKNALEAWRDWEPWEEYQPPCTEPWPPHDYE